MSRLRWESLPVRPPGMVGSSGFVVVSRSRSRSPRSPVVPFVPADGGFSYVQTVDNSRTVRQDRTMTISTPRARAIAAEYGLAHEDCLTRQFSLSTRAVPDVDLQPLYDETIEAGGYADDAGNEEASLQLLRLSEWVAVEARRRGIDIR